MSEPSPAQWGNLWREHAPDGQAYHCPDCDSVATLGGNAAFHATSSKHGFPVLKPWSPPADPNSVEGLTAENAALRAELQRAKDDLATARSDRDEVAEDLDDMREERDEQRERAESAERKLETANALLAKGQWGWRNWGYGQRYKGCPHCGQPERHSEDCELAAYLRGDVPEQPSPASPEVVRAYVDTVVADGMVLEGIPLGWRAAERHHGITGEPVVEQAARDDSEAPK